MIEETHSTNCLLVPSVFFENENWPMFRFILVTHTNAAINESFSSLLHSISLSVNLIQLLNVQKKTSQKQPENSKYRELIESKKGQKVNLAPTCFISSSILYETSPNSLPSNSVFSWKLLLPSILLRIYFLIIITLL